MISNRQSLSRALLVLFAIAVLSSPVTARAQQQGVSGETESTPIEGATTLDTELLLNAPVITATGREQSRALAPANVVSWERDEIYRHGWTTLAEVLANTAGLYVIDDLVLPSLGVRGVGPGLRGGTRLVRIMINGVAVNYRPDLTAFLGSEYLPFSEVERIEIAKGPLSALYGANAFLATINIITRKAVDKVEGEAGGHARIINSNTGFGFNGRLGFSNDWLSLTAAYSQENLDRKGLSLHRTFENQDPSSALFRGFFDGGTTQDKARPKSLFVSGEARSDSAGILRLQGGSQMLDSDANFQPGSVLTNRSRVAITNNWGSATYIYGYGHDVTLSITGDLSGGSPTSKERLYTTGDDIFSYTRNFGYLAAGAAAALEAKLPAQLELKIGSDYQYDREDILFYTQRYEVAQTGHPQGDLVNRIAPGTPTKETITNFGLYGQLGGNPFSFAPDLYFAGNIRYDGPNLFDNQVSWRTGLAYQWTPRLTTKLFVGRAFQTPTGVQLFAQPGFGQAYNTVGNRTTFVAGAGLPPVQPQSVVSLEFATTYAITNTIALEGALYYQQVRDKIEITQISTNFTTRNLANQDIAGGELGFRASSSRFAGYFTASVQAQNYEDSLRTQSFGVKPPPDLPNYTIYSGINMRLPEVYMVMDLTGRLVGPRGSSQSNTLLNNLRNYELPTYATFDLTLTSLEIFLFSDKAETRLLAGVKNLTDARFSYPGYGGLDIPSVGRTWFFRLAQTF